MKFNNEKKYPDSLDFSLTEKLIIERNKSVDSAVIMEIQKIAIENGIETKFTLNERNILNALKNQIAKKPIYWNNETYICPNCHRAEYIKQRDGLDVYCGGCGQLIDWSK
jgi:hypothetical protein